jgi:hypothetical protein
LSPDFKKPGIALFRANPVGLDLFEVPSGLRKFDPEALIKRIKQSDVWVDTPPP